MGCSSALGYLVLNKLCKPRDQTFCRIAAGWFPTWSFHMKVIIQTDHTQLTLWLDFWDWRVWGKWCLRVLPWWLSQLLLLKANIYFVKIAKPRTVECWVSPCVYRINRIETLTNAVSLSLWGAGCLPPAASVQSEWGPLEMQVSVSRASFHLPLVLVRRWWAPWVWAGQWLCRATFVFTLVG